MALSLGKKWCTRYTFSLGWHGPSNILMWIYWHDKRGIPVKAKCQSWWYSVPRTFRLIKLIPIVSFPTRRTDWNKLVVHSERMWPKGKGEKCVWFFFDVCFGILDGWEVDSAQKGWENWNGSEHWLKHMEQKKYKSEEQKNQRTEKWAGWSSESPIFV